MSAQEDYIERVVAQLPSQGSLRSQVAMELRSHIAERLEHGHTLEDALRQLGDPIKLAESYLSAVPLVPASFWSRVAARLLDFAAYVGLWVPILFLLSRRAPFGVVMVSGVVILIAGSLYPLIAEYWLGKTLGKHLLGLRVVRESGGPISLGQSVVRQLPVVLQVFWIDAMFALFTEKHQRAFELLSKTRVVVAMEEQ